MRTGMPGVMMGCSLAAALAVAAPAGAQTDGSVTWTMTRGAGEGGGNNTMTQYFKGSQMRVDIGGANGNAMIMDASSGNMMMLMASQHAYMQYNMAQMAQGAPPPQANAAQATVTPDGTETVAGISCTDYKISGGLTGQTEICVAPGVPSMDMKLLTNGPMAQYGRRMGITPETWSAFQQLKGKGLLKVYSIKNGTKAVEMVATKIDPTSPSASMFEIPAGYTKFSMPAGMPGGAGGAGAAPPQ